jgi:isopentenyl-diphosphate delta-isomerase
LLNCYAKQIDDLELQFPGFVEHLVAREGVQGGIAAQHVALGNAMARIDLAHVNPRVLTDLPGGQKVQRIEPRGVCLERKEPGPLQKLDRLQADGEREARQARGRQALVPGEDALEVARRGPKRRRQFDLPRPPFECQSAQGRADARPARGTIHAIPVRPFQALHTKGFDPTVRVTATNGRGIGARLVGLGWIDKMPDGAPPGEATEARKSRHLDICLEDDVASTIPAGFAAVRLRHEALPECALEDVDPSCTFLGLRLSAPLVISSMTGGTERAGAINRNLAVAAQAAGVALGLGSQRAALEDERLLASYRVRDVAPRVVLFGNLGAVQLNYRVTIDDARRAVESVGANGLYLHLNPLQEALQVAGDTNFRGLLGKIERLCRELEVPVIAKGVGSGISVRTARRLIDAGVAALDIAGAGGTSWARVEGRRSADPGRGDIAEAFAGWGYPTTEATVALRRAFPTVPLIASGGVRTGVDLAKALALGADLAGIGLPLLEPATRSTEAVSAALATILEAFRIALFASGCRRPAELPDALYTRGSDEIETVESTT